MFKFKVQVQTTVNELMCTQSVHNSLTCYKLSDDGTSTLRLVVIKTQTKSDGALVADEHCSVKNMLFHESD